MIPLPTTTVRVRRPTVGADPQETASAPTVTTGLPAHISDASGREANQGGQASTVTRVLACETWPLRHTDLVEDETTGDRYSVEWVTQRHGLGLDHTTAGLARVEGATSG